MNLVKKGFLMAVAALVLMVSCDKIEEPTKPVDVVSVAQEYTLVNKLFNDAANSNDDAVINAEASVGQNGGRITVEGPSISVDPADLTTFPKTITVDFMDGILGQDGVLRKGKVIVTSTNWHDVVGSVHTAEFEEYYQNGNKIEGIHKETNLGEVEGTNQRFQVEVIDGIVTTESGAKIFYEENSYRTQIAGQDTKLNIWDNEYLIEGVQNGVSSTDIDYSIETLEPLHFKVVPRGVYGGILSVNIGTYKDIEIDYNNSTITFLGNTYPFAN